MGAHSIEFEMAGAPSFSAIEKQFKKQQQDDNHENGNRSYSGDFQTVHEVKDHTYLTFDSYNEAHNYCMDNAKKWQNVIAVRYRFIDRNAFKYSAKVEKLDAKVKELALQLQTLERTPIKLKAFVTCEGCSSKINTSKLHHGTTQCPICREGDFRPLSIQRSIVKVKAKIKLAQELLETTKKVEKAKGMKKFGKVGTLVAGWGAS